MLFNHKKNKEQIHNSMLMDPENIAKWKMPDIESHISYNYVYVR